MTTDGRAMTADTTALRALADDGATRFANAPAGVAPEEMTREILGWAAGTFGRRWAVTAAMADTVLVHLASQAAPGVDVVFLDTGYHFVDTLATRDRAAARYDIRLLTITPRQSVAEQDDAHGPQLYARDPDRCCGLRKVEPLNRVLDGYDAWASGARREESPTRAELPLVGWDGRRGKVKLNPLAVWTEAEMRDYTAQHGLIDNPLLYDGYPSIGC